jgi:hypothetical protein
MLTSHDTPPNSLEDLDASSKMKIMTSLGIFLVCNTLRGKRGILELHDED